MVAILSLLVGAVIIALAGLGAWWYFAGGKSAAPSGQQEVVVTPPPATEPSPPPAPQPPPVAATPEGMVLVPAGAYIVGRDDGDALASPQRTVNLAPFYIDITEVTNAQYMLFVDARKRQPPAGWENGTYPQDRANWPVTGVSWQDAADYAAWAGKRLPTEIEWEAAARGADGRLFPWGNVFKSGLANIGTRGIREVGQYKAGASPCGALDMLGNVWEWTADELALYPGSTSQLPDSIRPGITYRIIRGGAYDGSKENDASYRGFVDASQGYPKTGFRCVKDAN
jgi:serine/threonine-protein kinase